MLDTAHRAAAAVTPLQRPLEGQLTGRYALRLAASQGDVRAAQALRFAVFNVELANGLAASYESGLDADNFDAVCDHLIVEDLHEDRVVGTYRLQSGLRAANALGYYSGFAFDMAPFEPFRAQMLELGRACVHAEHRNFAVLNLLWRGIARYAHEQGLRYLIGCSSLSSTRAEEGAAAWAQLAGFVAPPAWRTQAHAAVACPLARHDDRPVRLPRLLSAYLALGARICAPPAIDREFGSIDFLTWLDVESEGLQTLQKRGRFSG